MEWKLGNWKTEAGTKCVKEYVIKTQRGGGEDESGKDVCRIL